VSVTDPLASTALSSVRWLVVQSGLCFLNAPCVDGLFIISVVFVSRKTWPNTGYFYHY
jgi:hypothetical protein